MHAVAHADNSVSTRGSPPEPNKTEVLSGAQVDDLFARLASVDLTSLPHEATHGGKCCAEYIFRLCTDCKVYRLGA